MADPIDTCDTLAPREVSVYHCESQATRMLEIQRGTLIAQHKSAQLLPARLREDASVL